MLFVLCERERDKFAVSGMNPNKRPTTGQSSDDSFRTGGGLRDRGDFRRNVTPTAVPSSTWSCGGTVPRCRQCQSYDPHCLCRSERSSHLDPEIRAQNLKALMANTPFERAKAQRQRQGAFISLVEEEERVRLRIANLSKAAYSVIADHMASGNDQADFATVAFDTMEELMRQEYAARLRLVNYHRFKVPYLTACTDEHVERCGLVAVEDKRFREILRLHLWRCDVVDVADVEHTNRCTVMESEGRFRAAMWKAFQQDFRCVESMQDEVRSLALECSAGRDDVAQDEATQRSRLAEGLALGLRKLDAFMADRYKLFAEAERMFRMVVREHASHISLVKEELADTLDRLSELAEQHGREVLSLQTLESSTRDGQECLEMEDRAIIALEMSRNTQDIHTASEIKASERQALMREALAELTSIGTAYLERHSDIAAAELSERHARQAWVQHRNAEQRNAIDLAVAQMHFLFDDYNRELMVFWDAMHTQADDVAAWAEEKYHTREAFVVDVLQQHGIALFHEQLEVRRRLYDQMLQEEEALFEWLDIRDEVRNVAVASEMDCRRALERMEDVARGKLYSRWDGMLQEMHRREAMFWSAVESVDEAATADLHQVFYDESTAWDLLLQREEQSFMLAMDRQQFREVVEAEQIESHERRALDFDSMRTFELIFLQCAHERREITRKVQEAFADACCVVESEESEQRMYFLDTYKTQWGVLLLDAAKDREISMENEAARRREERFRMHEYYLEDHRLYDPDEEPLEESRMNMLEFRRSVCADLNMDANIGRKSCGGVPVTEWSEEDSRREFLSQALRGFNTSYLPREVVDLLVGVVSNINDVRSVEETQINSLYKEADRIQKEVARANATNVSDREKCREHEERNKRTETDNRVQHEHHRDRMKKHTASIRRYEEKLQQIMQEQRAMDEVVHRRKDEKAARCGVSSAARPAPPPRGTATVHHNSAGSGAATSQRYVHR